MDRMKINIYVVNENRKGLEFKRGVNMNRRFSMKNSEI